MDEDIEKMDRRNELLNKAFAWGMVVFLLLTIGLLAKMFISAL